MANSVEMLREDHKKVKELFEQFEEADEEDEKARIVETALQELEVHANLEEEIFYPTVREQIDDDEMMDEALEEHHVAKLLIAELKEMSPGDERFEAKFKVLSEAVKHHIEEEESEIFPKAEDIGLDLDSLGEEMTERREELQEGQPRSGSKSRGRKTPARSAQRSKGKVTGKRQSRPSKSTAYRKSA
jgi:hemerythrin-like domain-containing protein